MTEDLIRTAMDQFTQDVRVPAGLPDRAARQLRRRRRRAVATGIAAPLAAAAALAAVSSQHLIQYLRETASGPKVYQAADLPPGTYAEWAYRGQAKFVTYTADGRPASSWWAQLTPGQYTETKVTTGPPVSVRC